MLALTRVTHAGIGIKSEFIAAEFDPVGAALKSLRYKEKEFTAQQPSFRERLYRGKLIEDFGKLEFTLVKHDRRRIEFTARGVKAFDQVRFTKAFEVSRTHLLVHYEIENLGKTPQSVGVLIKTFLRSPGGQKTVYYQPRKDEVVRLEYPGRVAKNEISNEPAQRWAAFHGEDGIGATLTFPAGLNSTFFNYFGSVSTLEWYSSETVIAPGQTHKILVEVSCFDEFTPLDIPAGETDGKPAPFLRPELKLPDVAAQPLPESLRVVDVTVKRQFCDSIRSVLLPPDTDETKIAVYPLKNRRAETDRPLEFRTEEVAEGVRVFFKVPGLDHRGGMYGKVQDGFLYDRGPRGTCFGKIDMPCRITLDQAPSVKPSLVGSGLFINASLEEKAPYGDAPDGFYWNWAARRRGFFAWTKEGGRRNSRAIKIERGEKYSACVYLDFIPERGVNYRVSFWARSVAVTAPISATMTFLDADGNRLENVRSKPVGGGKHAFDWTQFETSFVAPERAAFMRLAFNSRGRDGQQLWIDDIAVECADIPAVPRGRAQIMRDELACGWYPDIDLIENISHDIETPHEKWFKPGPTQKYLYLSSIPHSYNTCEDTRRRFIVELAQRMNIEYTHIPLLPKRIGRIKSLLQLEGYSVEKLREVEKPGLVIINGQSFKAVQQEVIDLIKDWDLVIVDCRHIPPELRSKPAHSLRALGRKYQHLAGLDETTPSYYSRDVPYWEYAWLELIKKIRPDSPVAFTACDAQNVTMTSADAMSATLEVSFRDFYRHHAGTVRKTVELAKGDNRIALDAPALGGGKYMAHCRVLDGKGNVIQADAFLVDVPETGTVAIEAQDIYPLGKPVEFTVRADSGDKVEAYIEDVNGRIVAVEEQPLESANKFSFVLSPPNTLLNRIFVKVKDSGTTAAMRKIEFTAPGPKRDPREFHSAIWIARPQMNRTLKDLGFDMWGVGFNYKYHANGLFRHYLNLDIEPATIGSGRIVRDGSYLLYRGDKPSDPVRKPCYSDPEHQRKMRDTILRVARENRFKYYNVQNHFLQDEAFLGSTVCYSPHCLAAFRTYLRKQYASLKALNEEWETAFADWDKVIPQQIDELKSKENLSPWLDHKMFMARVYAREWAGNTRKYLNEAVPGSKSGLSGTQVPGYGYDWSQMMKYNDFIAYYGGVQRTLVNHFRSAASFAGQWGGGYRPAYRDSEAYNTCELWDNLLRGANMAMHYHGNVMNGDLKPSDNMLFYSRAMKAIKRGPGRLWLSAKPAYRQIAILYSQSSLFCAMQSVGKSEWQNAQTAWEALLKDLKYDYEFIGYEALAEPGVPGRLKVLILPAVLSISGREAAGICKFVEKGGTVIADFAPGRYDGHGKRTEQLADLFPLNKNEIAPKKEGALRKAEPGIPFNVSKDYGKGRAVLLNAISGGYQSVRLGGIGGETSVEGGGDVPLKRALADMVRPHFLGVEHDCEVVDDKGACYSCTAALRRNSEGHVFGIHRFDVGPARFDFKTFDKVTVTLPVSGYIYDIREGKFVTKGNRFPIDLVRGWTYMFSVLREEPAAPDFRIPAEVRAGPMLRMAFNAHALWHVSLVNPDGTTVTESNHDAKNVERQIAFNAPCGRWEVRAIRVDTGMKAAKAFTVRH